jgi:peptidoglycan L-alanyl-D-glutamate endopeptidase CwlK
MAYKLGKRSLSKLEGVDERMVAVVKHAITVSKQDFSVICGLRTIEEQRALVAKGASQTMKSKHLDGIAVDLMAYVDGGRWELNLYDEIADAMAEGARVCDVPIRWGAAWTVPNIAQWL